MPAVFIRTSTRAASSCALHNIGTERKFTSSPRQNLQRGTRTPVGHLSLLQLSLAVECHNRGTVHLCWRWFGKGNTGIRARNIELPAQSVEHCLYGYAHGRNKKHFTLRRHCKPWQPNHPAQQLSLGQWFGMGPALQIRPCPRFLSVPNSDVAL